MAPTPGPWNVRRAKLHVDDAFDFAISADGAPVLAEAFGRTSDGGRPDAEANARLIAAAPELLEALKWVRANYSGGSTKEINARIEAAISKAEGRS